MATSGQLKLDLALEPTLWEQLGFDDVDSSVDWLNEDYYESGYPKEQAARVYEAWSRCWEHANRIAMDPESTPRERDFASMVFAVMCDARKVPIVGCTLVMNGTPTIIQNQLD